MPILSFSFEWAWQTHFLRHTLQILKKNVSFKDSKMILVSCFHIVNQKSVIQENPILIVKFQPR